MKFEIGGIVPASGPIVIGQSCCCIHAHNLPPVEIQAQAINHAQEVHIHMTAAPDPSRLPDLDLRRALRRSIERAKPFAGV